MLDLSKSRKLLCLALFTPLTDPPASTDFHHLQRLSDSLAADSNADSPASQHRPRRLHQCFPQVRGYRRRGRLVRSTIGFARSPPLTPRRSQELSALLLSPVLQQVALHLPPTSHPHHSPQAIRLVRHGIREGRDARRVSALFGSQRSAAEGTEGHGQANTGPVEREEGIRALRRDQSLSASARR